MHHLSKKQRKKDNQDRKEKNGKTFKKKRKIKRERETNFFEICKLLLHQFKIVLQKIREEEKYHQ